MSSITAVIVTVDGTDYSFYDDEIINLDLIKRTPRKLFRALKGRPTIYITGKSYYEIYCDFYIARKSTLAKVKTVCDVKRANSHFEVIIFYRYRYDGGKTNYKVMTCDPNSIKYPGFAGVPLKSTIRARFVETDHRGVAVILPEDVVGV